MTCLNLHFGVHSKDSRCALGCPGNLAHELPYHFQSFRTGASRLNRRRMIRRLHMLRMRFLLSCVVGMLCCLSSIAQTGAGSIQGTITDGTGAVVADAKITAVNTATNTTRSTASSASGAYALANLPAGS